MVAFPKYSKTTNTALSLLLLRNTGWRAIPITNLSGPPCIAYFSSGATRGLYFHKFDGADVIWPDFNLDHTSPNIVKKTKGGL
jgi:hypothetical protein